MLSVLSSFPSNSALIPTYEPNLLGESLFDYQITNGSLNVNLGLPSIGNPYSTSYNKEICSNSLPKLSIDDYDPRLFLSEEIREPNKINTLGILEDFKEPIITGSYAKEDIYNINSTVVEGMAKRVKKYPGLFEPSTFDVPLKMSSFNEPASKPLLVDSPYMNTHASSYISAQAEYRDDAVSKKGPIFYFDFPDDDYGITFKTYHEKLKHKIIAIDTRRDIIDKVFMKKNNNNSLFAISEEDSNGRSDKEAILAEENENNSRNSHIKVPKDVPVNMLSLTCFLIAGVVACVVLPFLYYKISELKVDHRNMIVSLENKLMEKQTAIQFLNMEMTRIRSGKDPLYYPKDPKDAIRVPDLENRINYEIEVLKKQDEEEEKNFIMSQLKVNNSKRKSFRAKRSEDIDKRGKRAFERPRSPYRYQASANCAKDCKDGIPGTIGSPGDLGPTGPPGAPGLDGSPGKPGFQGKAGSEGRIGAPGPAGDVGRDGAPGLDGTPGLPGSKGQDGNPGADGLPGADGEIGESGAPGKKGNDATPGRDGKHGKDGLPGRDGNPGQPGRQGFRGGAGAPGNDGDPGADGSPGKEGAPGEAGGRGRDGTPGKQGPKGPAGNPGSDGRDGDQGENGNDGFPGQDGEPGRDGGPGVDGKIGAPGRNGNDGQAGSDGRPGRDGQPGFDGSAGRDGDAGSDGDAGQSGDSGKPGKDGAAGNPGQDGAAGNDGKPGQDGLPGSPGIDGKPGAPGIDGQAGIPGGPGNDGLPGNDGFPGLDGDSGLDGQTGAPGERGEAGAPGLDGPQGPIGSPGSSGPSGRPGSQGLAGLDGAPGKDGQPAERGPPGEVGDPGESGAPGADGRPGFAGTAGKAGSRGSAGRAGEAGAPGRDGSIGKDDNCNCQVFSMPQIGLGSSTYVIWGQTTCPRSTNAQLLYTGIAASGHFYLTGSGGDYHCLPDNPTFFKFTDSIDSKSKIYGAQYLINPASNPFRSGRGGVSGIKTGGISGKTVVCAVCHVTRNSQLMIPGSFRCPDGWTNEYNGFLMASLEKQTRTSFICVDEEAQSTGRAGGSNLNLIPGQGKNNKDGSVLVVVEVKCGNLPCRKYPDGYELPCAVCTR
ncbi:unnamed protein product [Gordionus sp. m RMFG-2023]